jgi:hypothetical protein
VKTIFTYDITTMVSSTTTSCGTPIVEWDRVDGQGTALEIMFVDELTVSTEFAVTIYATEQEMVGDYNIQFRFYFAQKPDVVITSDVFVLTIVSPCIPPPGCIDIADCGIAPPTVYVPDITITIDVTVSVSVTVDLPAWGCANEGCTNYVTPVCVDCEIGGHTDVVIIVDNTITINIETCEGICPDGPDGEVHIIIIEGCLGDVCVPVEIPCVIYNPCLIIDNFEI